MNTFYKMLPAMSLTRIFPLLALLVLFSACGGDTEEAADDMAADTTAMMEDHQDMTMSIMETAKADSNLTMFVAAVEKAGLGETLSGPGPFTVFAPSNAAFAALPAGTLDNLSAEELTNILTYHVANGRLMASDVAGMQMIPMAQGADMKITVGDDGSVMVNDSMITLTDIEADNGVIHVINKVMMPPSAAM